jgi:hypothetical protein
VNGSDWPKVVDESTATKDDLPGIKDESDGKKGKPP